MNTGDGRGAKDIAFPGRSVRPVHVTPAPHAPTAGARSLNVAEQKPASATTRNHHPGDGADQGGDLAAKTTPGPARESGRIDAETDVTPGRHRHHLTRPVTWGLSLGLAVATAGALAVLWTSGCLGTKKPLPGAETGVLAGREALDKGPWPTQGHDMRRTGQSHLAGPSRSEPVRLLYEATSPLSWEPGLAGRELSTLVAESDGTVAIGTCGSVSAIDLTGRTVWTRSLPPGPIREGVSGLTVGANGVMLVSTHECPSRASTRTHVYGLGPEGTILWSRTVGETYAGPAIGPSGLWYTVSDSNLVRAFGPSDVDPVWMTDLAGDRHSAFAVDSRGNLYAGTNGGESHRPSFWSLAPDGSVRWAVESGTLTTPVLSALDRIYVAGNSVLYAMDTNGVRAWSLTIGPLAGSWAPLAVGRSGTVYALTAIGLEAVTPDGRAAWTVPAEDGPALSPGPILDKDENVYVGLGNSVRSFTREGRPRWTAHLTAPGQLVIAADGVLCVIGERRKIFTIGQAR